MKGAIGLALAKFPSGTYGKSLCLIHRKDLNTEHLKGGEKLLKRVTYFLIICGYSLCLSMKIYFSIFRPEPITRREGVYV